MRDPLSRLSVKYKLALGFVGLCVIAFGAGGYLISRSARGTLEGEILSRLEFQCQAYATDLHAGLGTLMRRSEDFASDGYIRDHLLRIIGGQETADNILHAELLRHLKINKLPLEPAFMKLAVVSNDGKSFVVTDEFEDGRLEKLTNWSRGQSESICSQVFADEEGKSPTLYISTPILSLIDGKPIGHLFTGIRSGLWVAKAMRTDRLGRDKSREDVSLRLLDGRGQVLNVPPAFLNYRQPPEYSAPILSSRGLLVTSTAGDANANASADKSAGRLFRRSFPIGTTGWSAEVSIQAANALAPVTGLQTEFVVVGSIIALLALLVLYFPLRFLARPLIQLQHATQKIRQGDFTSRVEVDTHDEVGDLAKSFNLMASAIESRTLELESQAELLKKRQQEAKAQRDRLDRVISAMQDGLVVLDHQGNVILSNHAAGDILNLLESESKSLDRLASSHIPCNKSHRGEFKNCADCLSGAETASFSCLLDVEDRVFEVHATSLPSQTEGNSGRILVSRDVTERVNNEEREVHQERLAVLGEVAAVMAHELNNPLASISLFSQMMQAKLPADSELQENIDVIERNAETCKQVISELLGYAAKGDPDYEEINVVDVLENAIRFLQPIAERQSVSLKSELPSSALKVTGDEVQIRQVIVNLVMNSVQAIEGTGEVKLVCESDGSEAVTIRVIDNGTGISSSQREEIFRPFYTTKPLGEGTGLGLSTSLRIAKIHGGSLELVSSDESGTEFQIRLPLSANAS